MEIVITDIRREGEGRWVADLRLDETPGRVVLEFRPSWEDVPSLHVEPVWLENSREFREVAWLIRSVRKGERLTLPHRVEVGDRWPQWPSVNEPLPEPFQPREIVVLKIEEESPGMWAAETLVEGMPERVVVLFPDKTGPFTLVKCGDRLKYASGVIDVFRVLNQASKGRWPELPMRIPRGRPIWS